MGHRAVGKQVLVTGATGAVGPDLVQLLVQHGYVVRTLTRRPPAINLFPAGVETMLGDITDAETVHQAVAGSSVIFHLAAKLHINNPLPELTSEYEAVNIDGTRNVVEASQHSGVERLLYFSTINVYLQQPIEGVKCVEDDRLIITEDSPTGPTSIYGKTKLKGEQIALGTMNRHGQPLSTVLRLAAVYGPNMQGNYVRMAQALKRGIFVPVGDGQNRRTLVHSHDVARAALYAAESSKAAGQIYNVTDGYFHTMREIIDAICAAQKTRTPRLFLPASPLRFGITVARQLALFLGKELSIHPTTVDRLIEDVAVSSRLIAELDFTPHVPFKEGWKETLGPRTV